ncbi:MAG: hypothetical protein AB7I27_04795 [Bacteriovoracaceae bacterium]
MLDQTQIKNHWKEIQDGIRTIWGEVSDKEIAPAKENINSVVDIIQNKFGETRSSVEHKLNQLLDSFDNETDRTGLLESSYQRRPEEEDSGIDYDSKEIFEDHQQDFNH